MNARRATTRKCLYGAIGLSMSLFGPTLASAATVAAIIDVTDTLTASLSNANLVSVSGANEGIGVVGSLDIVFTYVDSTPPAPGSQSTTNYNIFGPTDISGGIPVLSDTLSIVVAGLATTAAGQPNVSVTLHFRSDSADEIAPPALIDAIVLIENGQLQTVPTIFGDVSDLTVQFRSDLDTTPIPAALPLFASGLGVLGVLGWRRKKKKAAP